MFVLDSFLISYDQRLVRRFYGKMVVARFNPFLAPVALYGLNLTLCGLHQDRIMMDIEKLKRLKMDYERLRDQYFLTKSLPHYLLFQKGFKAYRDFVDRHHISSQQIEALFHCAEGRRDSWEDAFSDRPQTQKKETERKKELLDFFSHHDGLVSVADISSSCILEETRIRVLLRLLVQDGLIERVTLNRKSYWRKRAE